MLNVFPFTVTWIGIVPFQTNCVAGLGVGKFTPVQTRATVCVLPAVGASSWKVIVAVSLLRELGVHCGTTWQLAVDTLPMQLLDATAKSGLSKVIGVASKVIGPLTRAATTAPLAEVVCSCTLPKLTLEGEGVTDDPATPVPVIATICGLPLALSVKVTV